jgi:hypothetical protein
MDDIATKPVDIRAQVDDIATKPVDIRAQVDDILTKPTDLRAQTADVLTQAVYRSFNPIVHTVFPPNRAKHHAPSRSTSHDDDAIVVDDDASAKIAPGSQILPAE